MEWASTLLVSANSEVRRVAGIPATTMDDEQSVGCAFRGIGYSVAIGGRIRVRLLRVSSRPARLQKRRRPGRDSLSSCTLSAEGFFCFCFLEQ